MSDRLTTRDLMAIQEALNSRLAGAIDNDDEPAALIVSDYIAALNKITGRLGRRSPKES